MTRTLRGVWARRGTLLPLYLLTAVVVAGVAATEAFTRGAGTSSAVAVPLLLLGLVAVPATGHQLATVRRGEIALARLRGLTTAPLYAVLALEPLLVLLAGAVTGVGLGAVVATVAGSLWVGSDAGLGVTAIPWVAGVVVVALVAVVSGMAAALREPLSEQVRLADRPRGASVALLFWHVLVIAGSVVAVYRASVAAGSDDPDWLVLAGPALVGLAVGQLCVWLVRGLARLSVAFPARRGLPGFLVSRRLARADGAGPLRLLVAATVVCAVSATGAQQVADWAGDSARLRAGAPIQVALDGDVQEAMRLTRDLDPDGRYLMAAALVPGEGSVPARRAFLDTARFGPVLGDFYDGTAAAAAADLLGGLEAPEGATVAVGEEVAATARGVSARDGGRLRARVEVVYVNDDGDEATVRLTLPVPEDGSEALATTEVADCTGGCRVTGLLLTRSAGDVPLPYLLTGIDFAGVEVLASSWASTGTGPFGTPAGPVQVDGGLLAVGDQAEQDAVPASDGPRTPILATDSATWADGPPLVDDTGGEERRAAVVARLPALPLVEADGLLADLPLISAGAPPTVPAAEVMVLAAADTPQPVLDRLTEATGTEPRTLDAVEEGLVEEAGAVQARAYALVAGFCLVVALLVAGATVARSRSAHHREVAVLRLVGVPLGQVRRSGQLELLVLALAAVVASAVGGWLAVRLLLSNLDLVTVPVHAVPLEIGVALLPILVAAGLAASLVGLVTGRSRRVRTDSGRPALLREEGAA